MPEQRPMTYPWARLLNASTVVASLVGYLEWGGDNSTFLWQAEWDVLARLAADFASVGHPFVLLPLAGQAALIISTLQRRPSAVLTCVGVGCLGLLLGFMTLIGIMGMNARVFLSTVPFLVVASLAMRHARHRLATS